MGQRYQGLGKKLTDAARYWAGGDPAPAALSIDDGVVEALVMCGAPAEIIERARNGRAASDGDENCFEVWEQNWDSVLFFLLVGTQWRAIGGIDRVLWLGLDYAGVETSMRAEQIARVNRKPLWSDLRAMERAALEVLNKQKE